MLYRNVEGYVTETCKLFLQTVNVLLLKLWISRYIHTT